MVLYFTGTGNSAYVAKRIADALGEEPVSLFDKLRNKDYSTLVSSTPWVICAPTYAWQMPHIVRDWLQHTFLGGNRNIYFVLTCGSSIGGAAGYAKALCDRRALHFKGLAGVVMPENYIAMFQAPEQPEAEAIVRRAEPVIDDIAAKIKAGADIGKNSTPAGYFLSSVVNRSFYAFSIKDKKFTVSDACVSCGLCEKNCPTANITLCGGKPTWHGQCIHCMACICSCPQSAIEYGKISIGKPRYHCPTL